VIRDAVRARSLWLRNLPARMALRYCNRPAVRRRLGARYDAALHRHRSSLPALDPVGQSILAQLERDGIAITSIDLLDLAGSDAMIDASFALALGYSAQARAQAAAGRQFMIVPPEQIAGNEAIFRWGLSNKLLDIVEAYIGLPPAYDGVAINYTVADGQEVSTRQWHQDWEDRRMLKVAVYLHEVDEQGGPFQVLCRADTRQSDAGGYAYGLADDATLQQRFGHDVGHDVVSCTGSRGTIIFADTARLFHRGKPAIARDRATLFFSYFAETPRHPFYCERTGMKRRALYALAKPLPARQRDAVMWRRRLPLPLRLIPPATL